MAVRTLLPYQRKWVADKSDFKVCLKGRRIGLSWAEAYDDVMHAAEGNGNIYYQSYAKDMTSGFINDCAEWCRVLQHGASEVGEDVIDDPDGDIPCYRIELSSGKEILAMTSAPRAFRSKGKPGDRAVIDEAAFVDDLDAVLDAVMAFLVWGGSVRVISTHNGDGSKFNRLLQDIERGVRDGSVHVIKFRDAVKAGLCRRIAAVAGKAWSPEYQKSWERTIRRRYGSAAKEELDCIASAGAGAWLTWNEIRRAQNSDAGKPRLTGTGSRFIAVDIARKLHKWVAVVFELVGDVFWMRKIVVRQNIPFSKQKRILRKLVKRYGPSRIAIDQTGLGMQIAEETVEEYGATRVVPVTFTPGNKLDMAIALKEMFEDNLIRIPPDDPDDPDDSLSDDLHSVRRSPTSGSGPPRIAADEGPDGSHGDQFWACAMAAWLTADLSAPFDGRTASDSAAENHKQALDIWSNSEVDVDYELGVARGASAHMAGFN